MKRREKPLKKIQISDDLISRNLDGEEVILNLETGIYFGLDPVGSKIWNDLKEKKSVSEITESLVREYDIPEKHIEKDVRTFTRALEKKGLIRTSQ